MRGSRLKIALWMCLFLLLAGIAACRSAATPAETPPSPTAIPTARPPTATQRSLTPTAAPVPTERLPTATPLQPATTPTEPTPTPEPQPTATLVWPPPTVPPSSSSEELSELLGVLPAGAIFVAFVEATKLPDGDLTRWYKDSEISLLSRRTGRVLSEEALIGAGIKRAAFGHTDYLAAILQGDFSGFVELLRQAPQLSIQKDVLPPSILDPYREVEVFLFTSHEDLYIAIPDSGTMLVALNAEVMQSMIDRYLDGAEPEKSLAGLLNAVGPVDFLVARRVDSETIGSAYPGPPFYFAGGGGWLDGTEISRVFSYLEYDSPEAAKEGMERSKDFPLVQGYNTGRNYPIREIRQEGRIVIAEGYAATFDLAGWLLGN